MKRFRYFLLTTCLLVSQAAFSGTTELKLRDDGTIDFSEYRGKVVYLDFWASWCVPCRQSFVWMNDIHDRYDDLVIIAVNLDTQREDAQTFLEQVPAKFDIAYDPEGRTARAYELKGMPSSFLIDKQGKVTATKVGFKLSETSKLESQIRELVR